MLDLSNDVNLFQGDCLEVMKGIPDGSIDLVLTDFVAQGWYNKNIICLLYTSPSPRDRTRSRMPSSA